MKRNFTHRQWMIAISFLLLLFASPFQSNGNPIEKMSLEQAIQKISIQYEVYFTYNKNLLQEIEVNLDVSEQKSLEEVMEQVLVRTKLQYRIHEEKYVIIYNSDREGISSLKKMAQHLDELIVMEEKRNTVQNSPSSRLGSTSLLSNMQLTRHRMVLNVSGVVTDQAGDPLIGVNVLVQGTNEGTATDINGRFSLRDVNQNATLVFSYIGYQKQEVALNGRTQITVTMIEDSQTLDEVVVVGYGTQNREDMTGSVSTVAAERLENRPVTNAATALQGVSPGLVVTRQSGQPGNEDIKIQIRGVTSINGDVDPLVILDGISVPVSTLQSMNPNDIESISVLKDAAAAAVYGAQASGGVIVVTTKKGEKGKTVFNYSNLFGASRFLNQ